MDQQGGDYIEKPVVVCGNLAKLPAALKPLIARPQWVIWRLTWRNGKWTKPPFRVDDPQRHASSTDPASWTDYRSAAAAVQAGHGDGITYVLTPDDPFAALDIDRVRDPATGTVEGWAQRLLDQASISYAEISPSGTGLRIWGTATGKSLHRQFAFGLELFRRTRKPLTITGLQLGNSKQLGNIDALIDRAVVWGNQQQHKKTKTKQGSSSISTGITGQYSLEEIELIVEEGAPEGANRSDTFHGVVGHYLGCGWTAEQIIALFVEHPGGVADRYIAEGRLASEVQRSIGAFTKDQPEEPQQQAWTSGWQQPEEEQLEEEPEEAPQLPPLYFHGEPGPPPIKSWAIKGLMPTRGHGLLSGQWGAFKTFVALDLSASLMTGQPFVDHLIKRQCGVLFLAAEGQHEMPPRLEALVREKCGGMARAPFCWQEDVPLLLQPDGLTLLVAMGKRAAKQLQEKFGLPLGLILIDTIAASAGYSAVGSENDNAINQRLMNVLKLGSLQLDCFVLGVDHFGKDIALGTRGGSAKESSGDLVLACLGDRALNGTVVNTRLAIRKCRSGRSGQEYPFGVREVELGVDEDGDPDTTLVIDWSAQPQTTPQPPQDPWGEDRQSETRSAMLLLKRIMMAKLAEHGTNLPSDPPIDPPLRGIDREIVRKAFYASTSVDGTEQQKAQTRRQRFNRAVQRAADKQLIDIREIDSITYFWFLHQNGAGDGDF